MRTRKKKLSQSDLRALGVQPGLLSTRYGPDGERVTVRQLTSEASGRPSLFSSKPPSLERRDSEAKSKETR